MANQDTSAALLGSGLVSAIEATQVTYSVAFDGVGGLDAMIYPYVDIPAIDLDGSLNGAVQSGAYINTYASLYGFLTSNLLNKLTPGCVDLIFEMEPGRIEILECSNEGELVDLDVFKDNTYPVTARLSIRGNYDITGHTIKMSTQLSGDTLYTVTGTLVDASNGEVSFQLNPLAVDTPGVGEYDIEGNDGTYRYTYGKGVFTVKDNLTPVV